MPNASTNNIDTIIDGRLYIGNLSAAKSVDLRRQFGITHTLSVCPDCPSQGPNHFIIPVQDSEYDDILIHLPQACRFIQNALDAGGRVLVHCLMGISRSATVVAAYLMSTRRISPHKALSIIKRARPQVLPNYGFIKQLNTFEACNYEPSKVDPTYRAWKRRHRQDVTYFLNYTTDTTSVVPEKLSLSSDFPKDPEQANCLVAYLGLTHCVSLSPSTTFPPDTGLRHRHFDIPQSNKAGLLLALPSICKHIHNTINDRGRVLVHSSAESTAAIVVCAYLMWSRRTSYEQAYASLHEALPLFNATESFTSLLKLYVACDYFPSVDHPALRDWLGPEHYRNTVPPPPRPASSPTRRAPGAALHTSGPWAKAGSQASHVLSSLVPVTLEG